MKSLKGAIPTIALFMIIGMIVIVSAWLFFIFFKVHITSLAVDVENVNRFQELPTTILGTAFFSGSSSFDEGGQYPEDAFIEGINCFNGNGPMGIHEPNYDLCTKPVAFHFTKFANVKSIQAKPHANIDINSLGDAVFSKSKSLFAPDYVYTTSDFVNGMRLILPENCYSVQFRTEEIVDEFTNDEGDCNLEFGKLNERYPLPIILNGEPSLVEHVLVIGSTVTTGEELLITWPKGQTEALEELIPESAEGEQ